MEDISFGKAGIPSVMSILANRRINATAFHTVPRRLAEKKDGRS